MHMMKSDQCGLYTGLNCRWLPGSLVDYWPDAMPCSLQVWEVQTEEVHVLCKLHCLDCLHWLLLAAPLSIPGTKCTCCPAANANTLC